MNYSELRYREMLYYALINAFLTKAETAALIGFIIFISQNGNTVLSNGIIKEMKRYLEISDEDIICAGPPLIPS